VLAHHEKACFWLFVVGMGFKVVRKRKKEKSGKTKFFHLRKKTKRKNGHTQKTASSHPQFGHVFLPRRKYKKVSPELRGTLHRRGGSHQYKKVS